MNEHKACNARNARIIRIELRVANMVAHYRSGDPLQAMPWTRDHMTLAEFEEWVASRQEAGRAIDIETCELGHWYADECDPYGLHETRGEEFVTIGTNRFVRSPESRGWVWEGDLPVEKAKAMYDRIYREWEAYVRTLPKEPG